MNITEIMPPEEMTKSAKNAEAEIRELREELETFKKKYLGKSLLADLFKYIEFINNQDFDLDVFFDRIMDWLTNATDTLSAALLLLDDTGENLRFVMAKGPNSEQLVGTKMSAIEGIAGKVVSTGQPHISQNVQTDPTWSPRIAETINYETLNLLAVPLKVKGESSGVIEIINKKDGKPFEKSDISLLEALSVEIAVALENAKLLAETKRRAEDFKTLSRLSAILNTSLNPKDVRKRAMESVVELLECETGSLYLIDHEKNELYFEVALGDKGDAVKEIRLKMGEGVAGWVAQEGKSDLVPDTSKDPRWASRVDEKSKFKTLNMITVPLRGKNEVIGVLQAINKLKGKEPNQSDLKLLENLSYQVSIALENARLYEEQKAMFMETAQALATAIEKRDPYTGGHTKRVLEYSVAIAKYMYLPPEKTEWLELTAIMHDIGKIGVNDAILRKPGKLTDDEFNQMRKHPSYGHDILQHVKQLEPAIPGMKSHHERFDGKGYPDGAKGTDIPLLARIISVSDAWDAMTSDRPYRDGLSEEIAINELMEFSGTQFDPEVIEAFMIAYHKGEISSYGVKKKRLAEEKTNKTEIDENSKGNQP